MNWGSSPAPGPSGIGTAGTPAEATDSESPTRAKAMLATRQRRIGDRARPTQGPRPSASTAAYVYLNFPGFLEEGADIIRRATPRTSRGSSRSDPANRFRLNANIPPRE